MHRVLLALGFLLAGITQALALAGQQRTVMMQPPGWVQASTPGAAIAEDFARARWWTTWGYTGPYVLNSITRASSKSVFTLGGLLETITNSNQLAYSDQGLLTEETRTDDALWVRDLTQAGIWTLVGATAALNATGIDGAANSATTLTSTGSAGVCTASCTALQTITLGSSADTYSVYLKRVTGSGAVNITINNLVGSQACTLVTTAFTRCTVTATLANPVFGIQMTTVGDVIVADWSQLEPGGFPTSPIVPAATTVAVTRAADNVTMGSILSYVGISGTIVTRAITPIHDGNFHIATEGSGVSGITLSYDGITSTEIDARNGSVAGGRGTLSNSGVGIAGSSLNMAVSWDSSTTPFGSFNGSSSAYSAKTQLDFASPLYIGSRGGSSLFLDSTISSIAIYRSKNSQSQINSTTQ